MNAHQHLLLRHGEVVPLLPKAIDLLVVRIELNIEPAWDKTRSDPRFDNLLARVGLPH